VNVFDFDKNGGHDLIGSLRTTFREWTFGAFEFPLTRSQGDKYTCFAIVSFLVVG